MLISEGRKGPAYMSCFLMYRTLWSGWAGEWWPWADTSARNTIMQRIVAGGRCAPPTVSGTEGCPGGLLSEALTEVLTFPPSQPGRKCTVFRHRRDSGLLPPISWYAVRMISQSCRSSQTLIRLSRAVMSRSAFLGQRRDCDPVGVPRHIRHRR